MCFCKLARSVNRPVDSRATWQPSFFQGRAAGSFSVVIGISLPLTTMLCSRAVTVPLNRPCTLSYFKRSARCFGSDRSLIATTSKSEGRSAMTRNTSRPIRPNPLIPTRNATTDLLVQHVEYHLHTQLRQFPVSDLILTDSCVGFVAVMIRADHCESYRCGSRTVRTHCCGRPPSETSSFQLR